jgi:hypothetical protein
MKNLLLIYNANSGVSERVVQWKRKNSQLGNFVDLMTLGEPVELFTNKDRPYLSFLKLQIERRVNKYSISKVIIFSEKYYGRKSIAEIGVLNEISYELLPNKVQEEFQYKKMLLGGFRFK